MCITDKKKATTQVPQTDRHSANTREPIPVDLLRVQDIPLADAFELNVKLSNIV